jgi:DNA-binding NarL/FixJ family response regulator
VNENSERIRVLLADDHRLFREALKSVLIDHCDVVGEAENAEDAIAMASNTRAHVVLLDIGMPGLGGLAAAHRIAKSSPGARVLILSQYDDDEYVLEALNEAGAAGYMLKTDAAAELVSAIRAVHSGRRYISPSVAPIVLGQLKRPPGERDNGARALTRREREVLRLIGEGATAKEIASKLKISPKTAQAHRDNLKRKLDLPTTAAIVKYAVKHKLVRLD